MKCIFLFLFTILVYIRSFSQNPFSSIIDNRITVLPASDAEITNGLKTNEFQNLDNDSKVFAVEGWKDKNQTFTWNVTVSKKGNYRAAILLHISGLSIKDSARIRLSANHQNIGLLSPNTEWNRIYFPGTLWLDKGYNKLQLHLADILIGDRPDISVYSIEVATEKVLERNIGTAKMLRSKPKWLTNAKYGLFFHWNARSKPRTGIAKSYEKATKDFDVTRFAAMVHETGADFIEFTTSWDLFTFPAPLSSIDKISPGNTTSRDLIADLSDALSRWNIKLMVYCNFRINKMGWEKEDRFLPEKMDSIFGKMISIYKEIGQRYAKKIAGFWIDDGMGLYPYNVPFLTLEHAMKHNDRNLVIGYNSWVYPRFTDYQDYYCGEEGITLEAAVNDSNYLIKGGDGYFVSGPYQGLKATFCGLLEPGNWTHTQSNTDIPPPMFTSPQLIQIVKYAMLRKNVPIMNVEVYQDGSISDETFELLKQLNKSIH